MTLTEVRQLSPAALAFYGDCVYEGFVRRMILNEGNRPSHMLHKMSVELVRASFQAQAFDTILPVLSEEEADILRRGRNASGLNPPKSSSASEYHKATAVEALFGYLSLLGKDERAEELFGVIMNERKEKTEKD